MGCDLGLQKVRSIDLLKVGCGSGVCKGVCG